MDPVSLLQLLKSEIRVVVDHRIPWCPAPVRRGRHLLLLEGYFAFPDRTLASRVTGLTRVRIGMGSKNLIVRVGPRKHSSFPLSDPYLVKRLRRDLKCVFYYLSNVDSEYWRLPDEEDKI